MKDPRRLAALLAAMATVGTCAILAPQAVAADAHPCEATVAQSWSTKGKVQRCALSSPESNGWIPVYRNPVARAAGAALPPPDGWLHGTANQYFVCQSQTAQTFVHARGWFNNWWAHTKADSGIAWGYVPEVYFAGGANNEADAGLGRCAAGTAPAPGPQPAPPPNTAERGTCGSADQYTEMKIRDDQRLNIKARGIDHRLLEITSQTPPEQHTHMKTRSDAGSAKLQLATCKTRRGPWRLLRAGGQSLRVDHPKQLHKLKAGESWIGFAIRRIDARYRSLRGDEDEAGRMLVEGIMCTKSAGLGLLPLVAGFPIPGASYGIGVGQWILGAVLPSNDDVECGTLDTSSATLYVNKRTGRLRVGHWGLVGVVSRSPEPRDFHFLVRRVFVDGAQSR